MPTGRGVRGQVVAVLAAVLTALAGLSGAGEQGVPEVGRVSSLQGAVPQRADAVSPWARALDISGEPLYVATAAHLSGVAGTNWRTDLVVHNPTAATVQVEIALLKREVSNTAPATMGFALPAGQTRAISDLLWQEFSFAGAAALRITASGGGVLVSSRTYNDQPGGTFGQLVPALTVSEAIGSGESARLIGLTHDPTGTAGSRTNLGLVNPNDRTIRVQVKLHDSSGALLGALADTWVQPYGYVQIDKVFERVTSAAVAGGFAVVSADVPCFAFASVIDNRTGDPVFVPARRLALGAPLVIATAAHLSGAAGTNWRTDVDIHNPGATQVDYTIALLVRGQANLSPATRTYTLEPGRSARYTDVLQSVFGFSGAAALRVTPQGGSLHVTSRTYNQRSDGTYGQFVPGLPDALAFAAGETARLIQLAEAGTLASGFRSNLGLVNASAVAVQLRVDLRGADGSLFGTLPSDLTRLQPYEYRQIDRVLQKVTSASVLAASAVVSTTTPGGRFHAFASVIDNRTGDPICVPAQRAGEQYTVARQFLESSAFWNDLAMVSPTTGWAVGDPHWDQPLKKFVGTISTTTDGGVTWMQQAVPVAQVLRGVSFVDASRGWAVGDHGTVLGTSDGGVTWSVQSIPTTDHLRDVVFVSAQRGWVTSLRETHWNWQGEADDWEAGILSTSSGGASWVQQNVPAGISILHGITFVDPSRGWAVGVRRVSTDPVPEHRLVILHTSDGGVSWQTQHAPDVAIALTAVSFVSPSTGWAVGFKTNSGQDGGTVLSTTDGGGTWTRVPTSETVHNPANAFWDVKFLDANRGYAVGMDYISAWGTPVWRTLDGGTTWEKVKQRQNDNKALRGLAVFAGSVVAVGDHDFVSISTDPWGSYGWPVGENLFAQHYAGVHYQLEDVFFADGERGWAVGRRSFAPEVWGQVILHTPDGGATWTTQYERAPAASVSSSVFRLNAVTFVDAQRGWAVGRSETVAGSEFGGLVLRTTDGGQSWVEQGQELPSEWELEFTAVRFLDAQRGWALEKGHYDPVLGRVAHFLAHTDDGGSSWQWMPTRIEGTTTVGYEVVQGGVFFTDPQHGWAAGGLGQVIATSDGGASWRRQQIQCGYPSCHVHLSNLTFTAPQVGWIAAESGLYVTADGGESWLPRDLGAGAVDYNGVQFPSPRQGWLAGGRGVLFASPDAGMSWRRVTTPTGLNLLGMHFPAPDTGWTVGEMGEILKVSMLRP